MGDENSWKSSFDKFDEDGSGCICAREITNLLESIKNADGEQALDHDKVISITAVRLYSLFC